MKKLLSMAFTALLLSACTSMPLKTLYKLAATDMMTVDPVVLRAAVRMPDWVMPRTDGVTLALGMTRAGETPQQEQFILEAIPARLEGKTLAAADQAGSEVYAYRLSQQDIARFKAFRDDLKAQKAVDKNTKGSLGIGVDACRRTALPPGKIPVTTYLRLDTESGYLPLVVDYDLKQPLEGKSLAAMIPPC